MPCDWTPGRYRNRFGRPEFRRPPAQNHHLELPPLRTAALALTVPESSSTRPIDHGKWEPKLVNSDLTNWPEHGRPETLKKQREAGGNVWLTQSLYGRCS